MNTDMTDVLSAPAPGAKMSIPKRLIGVFTNPTATFEDIKNKPEWIIAALIFIIILSATMYIQFSDAGIIQEQKDLMMQKMEQRGSTQAQIEVAERMTDKMRPFIPIITIIQFFIGLIIAGSGVWLFVSNVVYGAKARYGHMLAVTSYTSLIVALGSLIKLPIMLSKHTSFVHFSAATFMSDAARNTFLYKFLMYSTDLFTIWIIALLSIGVATVSGAKVNKVWPVVVGINLVFYVILALVS